MKYRNSTYSILRNLVDSGHNALWAPFNREDVGRLWEVVQAAEGIETVTNPVHARQRLQKALEGLRETKAGEAQA